MDYCDEKKRKKCCCLFAVVEVFRTWCEGGSGVCIRIGNEWLASKSCAFSLSKMVE